MSKRLKSEQGEDYEVVFIRYVVGMHHVKAWTSRVVHQEDVHDGAHITIVNKSKRQSLEGFSVVKDEVIKTVDELTKKHRMKFVTLHSTTPYRQGEFKKLAQEIAKEKGWVVYQDRNYFMIHNPALPIVQAKFN